MSRGNAGSFGEAREEDVSGGAYCCGDSSPGRIKSAHPVGYDLRYDLGVTV